MATEAITGLRILDRLLFDPERRLLRILRKETAHGIAGAPPALFPDGRTEAPFCACVHVERPEHFPALAKEGLGALLDADLVHYSGLIDGCIAFELVQPQRNGLRPSRGGASLALLGEGGALTAPQHWDVFAFHPKERKICFFREGRRLGFFEGKVVRAVFPDPLLNEGSLGLVLQEAARALFGLVAKPILDEPNPTALVGWKCSRLVTPAPRLPAAAGPFVMEPPAPPTRARRPAGRR